MKTIKARYNCGNWIWDCPVCNAATIVKPQKGLMSMCGGCYEDKQAKKAAVINGVVVIGIDKAKQDQAKKQAWADGRVYKISFPKDYKQIEEVLRVRKPEHRSWDIGQTAEDLEIENAAHPVLSYLNEKKKVQEPVKKEKPKKLAELDDATLRRIV
jgi:hypothetical protein